MSLRHLPPGLQTQAQTCSGLGLAGLRYQRTNAVGHLRANTYPMINATGIYPETVFLTSRYRVEEAKTLDVTTITLAADVGYHDVVERTLFCATACQTNFNHTKPFLKKRRPLHGDRFEIMKVNAPLYLIYSGMEVTFQEIHPVPLHQVACDP